MTKTDDTRALGRIDLPGGLQFRPVKAFRDGYELVDAKGECIGPQWWHGRSARAFAVAMSTPAPRVPSREEIAQTGFEAWYGQRVSSLEEFPEIVSMWGRVADAVLALFSAPAQAARGTVTDEGRVLNAVSAFWQIRNTGSLEPGETASDRSDITAMRAALEAASIPSRPEPAAPVVHHHPNNSPEFQAAFNLGLAVSKKLYTEANAISEPAAPVVPEELRQLSEKATKGPWSSPRSDPKMSADIWWLVGNPGPMEKDIGSVLGGPVVQGINAALIVASVNFVRTLLARQPAAPAVAPGTDAARDVLAERRRQVEAEGWTPEHDDRHLIGDLAAAAGVYALTASNRAPYTKQGILANFWPFEIDWYKESDPRRKLVKAGALILAEIERLDRMCALLARQPVPPAASDEREGTR